MLFFQNMVFDTIILHVAKLARKWILPVMRTPDIFKINLRLTMNRCFYNSEAERYLKNFRLNLAFICFTSNNI